MSKIDEVVADAIALAGGRVVGRTRLQKIIYLLEQKGLGSGVSYYYYNYGPFSDDVANAVVDAKFFGCINEKTERRVSDGNPYSVFETDKDPSEVKNLGNLDTNDAKNYLVRMNDASSVVLELAATAHWLAKVEGIADWRTELVRRKGAKTEGDRVTKAYSLLKELDLAQGV